MKKVKMLLKKSVQIICILLFASLISCNNVSIQVAETNTVPGRNETLICTGGLWETPDFWNPVTAPNLPPGTIGLVYETLFQFDSLTGKMVPWLAEKGEWSSNTFTLTLREGLSWSDGKPFTAEDVRFTWELGKQYKEIHYNPVWEWLDKITVTDERTLRFVFSDPHYQEWEFNLYQIPIIPKHIWSLKTKDEILNDPFENGIGSGSYLLGGYKEDRMIYVKNEKWWGIKVLGYNPAPKRIEYLMVSDPREALQMLVNGELDLSNLMITGISELKKPNPVRTWYKNAPYNLSDSTCFLFFNTQKKPLNDPLLRKAMACAIDTRKLVKDVYNNIVLPANNLGFLPIPNWMKYYDEKVIAQYGFSYNPELAKKLLTEAGYLDRDGDGIRETKDGKAINLTLLVPDGWTDWMDCAKVISNDLRAVGLNVNPGFPDFERYWDAVVANQTFDLAINNFRAFVTNTVWTLYYWLFKDVEEIKAYGGLVNANYGRYDNKELAALLMKLNRTPVTDFQENKRIISAMSKIFLQEMPVIPLWYNGLWYQASEVIWKNWPDAGNPYITPCTWEERWQSSVQLVTEIKPVINK